MLKRLFKLYDPPAGHDLSAKRSSAFERLHTLDTRFTRAFTRLATRNSLKMCDTTTECRQTDTLSKSNLQSQTPKGPNDIEEKKDVGPSRGLKNFKAKLVSFPEVTT